MDQFLGILFNSLKIVNLQKNIFRKITLEWKIYESILNNQRFSIRNLLLIFLD